MHAARTGWMPVTPRRLSRLAVAAMAGVLVMLALFAAAPARADETASLQATQEAGYGRLVFDFSALPDYEVEATTGVLVVTFSAPVAFDVEGIAKNLPAYVSAARRDPDGKALRIALVQPVTINTMAAGTALYLDFLPAGWAGAPPGLPPEVVAELERQARIAEQKAREEALKKAGLLEVPVVRVETGQLPTFTRVSFMWDRKIDAQVSRNDTEITVRFSSRGDLDLSPLRGQPPRFVSAAMAENSDKGLVVRFNVPHAASIRAFAEGKSFVVDVAPRADVLARSSELDAVARQAAEAAARAGENSVTQIDGQAPENVMDPPAGKKRVVTSIVPFDPARVSRRAYADWDAPEAAASVNAVRGAIERDEVKVGDTAPVMPPEHDEVGPRLGQNSAKSGPDDARNAMTAEEASGDVPEDAADEATADAPDARVVHVAGSRIGKSVRLNFPFARPVAAAVFQRAGTIWLVFDSAQPVDVHGLAAEFSDRFESIQVGRRDQVQFVRMRLDRPGLATVEVDERLWSVTIADLLLEPSRPVGLKRGFDADGQPQVTADLPDAGQVHLIEDPQVGDRLMVVTAFGPPRGLVKRQDFVQFDALASAHGLVFAPIADDVSVTMENNQVRIGRREGLWISAGSVRQYLPGRNEVFDDLRPGYINFTGIRAPGPAKFLAARQQLALAAAHADKSGQRAAQLTLARFYTGHGLAAEALGVLGYLARTDPDMERDPLFNATRGIANVLMDRPDEARADFAVHGLSQSRDIALWRGLAAAMRGNWREAQAQIADGEPVMETYPPDLKARFLLAATRAALENRDLPEAEHYLQAIEDDAGKVSVQAEMLYLAARLYEARGRSDEALQGYYRAVEMDVRPVAAEAQLARIELLRKLGRLNGDETMDELETLAIAWRGDEVELGARKMLARLHAERGEYRKAFEQVHMALYVDPDSDITRHIQDEMAIVFQDLFLHGKSEAMEPVEALSLYYDYSDMTPAGRLGDDMIRALSDRLIEVDLLDQAVELLTHQVDNRLHGAAKSQVAARLAFALMLNREPADALKVIARTRWAQLPKSVQRQRNLIEARALAEMGRTELALDLLDTMQGEDIDRIRTEALWHGHMWARAAASLEERLGATWQVPGVLAPDQRFDVMRAAIAYSLADDQAALDRLHHHFADKMSDSPDANAFQIVTQPIRSKTAAFGELARSIAGTDSLKAFLTEFRKQYGNGGEAREEGGEGRNPAS